MNDYVNNYDKTIFSYTFNIYVFIIWPSKPTDLAQSFPNINILITLILLLINSVLCGEHVIT